jgi:SAM-dependent methyltransferase
LKSLTKSTSLDPVAPPGTLDDDRLRLDWLLSAASVFLGAGLLFGIEPIVAKAILPWFGGAAAVWTACMLFFQSVLLLGYLYAHIVAQWRSVRRIAAVHVTLLVTSMFLLPALPNARWKPSGGEDPVWMILGALGSSVGLPFFLLSATSPLAQALFARRRQAAPYRLFALSNLASLLALLSYPVVVEPLLPVRDQAIAWSSAYGLYAVIISALIWRSRAAKVDPLRARLENDDSPAWSARISWVLLAACASTLFLGATNHLCQNIAPIPFLWILPLSVYLVSFILCFDEDKWYTRRRFLPLHAAAMAALTHLLVPRSGGLDLRFILPAIAVCLFCLCMYCHGELALRKPSPRYLTQYYLLISLGSAIGALLVSVVAPLVLTGYFDFSVALAACAILTLMLEYRKSWVTDLIWTALAVAVLVSAGAQIQAYVKDARITARNFYGGLRVSDAAEPPLGLRRTLVHGIIAHGAQFLSPERRRQPTLYFAPGSGVQLAIDAFRAAPARVGIIGLGAGTLAAYGRKGDFYRFYEINPLVIDLAKREFTFLSDSEATVELVLGDGRSSLEAETDQPYDLFVVDAFSGDSIPVHLLSLEAFDLYFRHLKPNGVLALHISNQSLDLEPVVQKAAERYHYSALLFSNMGNPGSGQSQAFWALMTRGSWPAGSLLNKKGRPLNAKQHLRAWTDGYSNLFQILR